MVKKDKPGICSHRLYCPADVKLRLDRDFQTQNEAKNRLACFLFDFFCRDGKFNKVLFLDRNGIGREMAKTGADLFGARFVDFDAQWLASNGSDRERSFNLITGRWHRFQNRSGIFLIENFELLLGRTLLLDVLLETINSIRFRRWESLVRTDHILFIFSGQFPELEEIARTRLSGQGKTRLDDEGVRSRIELQDTVKAGLRPFFKNIVPFDPN